MVYEYCIKIIIKKQPLLVESPLNQQQLFTILSNSVDIMQNNFLEEYLQPHNYHKCLHSLNQWDVANAARFRKRNFATGHALEPIIQRRADVNMSTIQEFKFPTPTMCQQSPELSCKYSHTL